ncbi:MAG: pyruvate kinase [Phycisphaerae bacterium]|nr:MAG: pyruvate kinase [Phycisphaerae bacterium]
MPDVSTRATSTVGDPKGRASWLGTKVVATIGPGSSKPEVLEPLLLSGVHVVRINFSHGSLDDHKEVVDRVREIADRHQLTVAIMGDLCGPKIRLGPVKDNGVAIETGSTLRIVTEELVGDATRVCTNQPDVLKDIKVGHRVLVDDGMIRFVVTESNEDGLVCKCEIGGIIRSRKGVNLPDSDLRIDALTEKDRTDLKWAITNDLDYLAISFVRTAADVKLLRRLIEAECVEVHIVSKIETPQAVRDIDNIIEASDAILVARGDLGVEMDIVHVPRVQKEICARCRRYGTPVIIATQMLQTMVTEAIPTRAEVSDVANAIVDGADAVMMSAETAVGKYPIAAVEIMNRIAAEADRYSDHLSRAVAANEFCRGVTAAVGHSIQSVAENVDAVAVAIWTEKGVLARLLSRHRIDQPIVALTPSDAIRRRLALYYGVTSATVGKPDDTRKCLQKADEVLAQQGWAKEGDPIVMGFGPASMEWGDTGSITIHRLGARRR